VIRARVAFAAWVALCGCGTTHLRPNAPGNIDVRKPPVDIATRGVEEPGDPGEDWLMLTYGLLAGGGATVREGAGDASGGALSLELSLHYGESRGSHVVDDDLFPPHASDEVAVNLGYQAIAPDGSADLTALRPFYLEAQYMDVGWIAAGWQVDFERGRHGPQLTGGLGPLYARLVHLFGAETQFEAGIVIKGWHSWVWSR
jgi:hypothetical protein